MLRHRVKYHCTVFMTILTLKKKHLPGIQKISVNIKKISVNIKKISVNIKKISADIRKYRQTLWYQYHFQTIAIKSFVSNVDFQTL